MPREDEGEYVGSRTFPALMPRTTPDLGGGGLRSGLWGQVAVTATTRSLSWMENDSYGLPSHELGRDDFLSNNSTKKKWKWTREVSIMPRISEGLCVGVNECPGL